MVKGLVFIAIIFLTGCVEHNSMHFTQQQLLGRWSLTDKSQINYPSLEFNKDSTAIFSSRADTVYRFQYTLTGDSLILKDLYGIVNVSKIKLLDSTNLVFYSLLNKESVQAYERQ